MKTKKIILLGFIIALLGSCTKYLEPYPNGNYDSETMWEYPNLVQGLIGYCYDKCAIHLEHTGTIMTMKESTLMELPMMRL